MLTPSYTVTDWSLYKKDEGSGTRVYRCLLGVGSTTVRRHVITVNDIIPMIVLEICEWDGSTPSADLESFSICRVFPTSIKSALEFVNRYEKYRSGWTPTWVPGP